MVKRIFYLRPSLINLKLMSSSLPFRLDKYRPKKNRFNDVVFESHIYFDDAFLTKNNNRRVNEYAETLVEVIKEVYL